MLGPKFYPFKSTKAPIRPCMFRLYFILTTKICRRISFRKLFVQYTYTLSRKLPTRAGSVGEIIFNGSVLNNNARYRLFRCKTSTDTGMQQCVDMVSICLIRLRKQILSKIGPQCIMRYVLEQTERVT